MTKQRITFCVLIALLSATGAAAVGGVVGYRYGSWDTNRDFIANRDNKALLWRTMGVCTSENTFQATALGKSVAQCKGF